MSNSFVSFSTHTDNYWDLCDISSNLGTTQVLASYSFKLIIVPSCQTNQILSEFAHLKCSTTWASKSSCEVSVRGKATSHMGHVLAEAEAAACDAEVADSVREDIDIPAGGEEGRGAAWEHKEPSSNVIMN